MAYSQQHHQIYTNPNHIDLPASLPPQPYPQPQVFPDQRYGYNQSAGQVAMPPPPQRPIDQQPYRHNTQPSPAPITTHQAAPPSTHSPQLRPPPISMAAPVTATTSAQSTPTSEAPSTHPKTPPTQKPSSLVPQEQARVAALLNLNNVLLREASALQAAGANIPSQSPPQPPPASKPGEPATSPPTDPAQKSALGATVTTPTTATPIPKTPGSIPSKKSRLENYLKRVQFNIAYLLAITQGKPVHHFTNTNPMEPPPVNWLLASSPEGNGEAGESMVKGSGADEMREAYARVRESWPSKTSQAQQQMQSGQQQQQGQSSQQQPQPQPVPATGQAGHS